MWFRTLHRDHGDDIQNKAQEKGENFMHDTAKYIGRGLIPIEGEA